MKSNKDGRIHVRLDSDLTDFVQAVLKERRGGISRFINDKIREEMKKAAK
jgi:hypothetical protein